MSHFKVGVPWLVVVLPVAMALRKIKDGNITIPDLKIYCKTK